MNISKYNGKPVNVKYVLLPAPVHGAAVIYKRSVLIAINKMISEEEQIEAYRHELRHLLRGDHYSADDIRTVEA